MFFRRKKNRFFRRRSLSIKRRFHRKKTTSLKRKRTTRKVSASPWTSLRGCRTNYVRYMYQNTGANDIVVPTNTTNPNSSTVQYMNTVYYQLDQLNLLDTLLYNYSSMYRKFRIANMWVEITPKFNNSDIDQFDQLGELWIIPIRETEQIARTNPLTVFGGAFPPNTVRDIDYWKNVKGAKRFTFNKPGSKARMKIPATIFRYIMTNPAVNSGAGAGYNEQVIKSQWLPCVSWSAVVGGSQNLTQHWGYTIIMCGWNTDAAKSFKFTLRQWVEVEYKEYMPNVSALGLELKKVDQETPYDEGPWDDEDDRKTVVVDPPYPQTLPQVEKMVISAPQQAKPAGATRSLSKRSLT